MRVPADPPGSGADTDEEALPGLAMALTGDRAAAAALLGEVAVSTRRDGGDVSWPADRDRLALLALRRRGAAAPAPPDRDDLPDGLAEVAVALGGLDPLSRTAIVLSQLLGLTLGEISGVLDRPLAVVRRAQTSGLDALGGDPDAVSATLRALTGQRPDEDQLRAAAARATAARRGRRRRVGAVVTLLALALVAAVGIPLARRAADPPPYLRPPGIWAYGLDVVLPPGWQIVSHWVTPTLELLELRPTADPVAEHACNVESGFEQVGRLASSPSPKPVVVGHLHGYAGRAQDGQPTVTLNSVDGRAVTVVCSGVPDADQWVLDVAGRVRYRRTPLKLPLAFTRFPAGYQLDSIDISRGETAINASRLPVTQGAWRQLIVQAPAEPPRGAPGRRVPLREGLDGQVWVDSGDVTLCLTPQGIPVCLGAPLSSDAAHRAERRTETSQVTAELVGLARSLKFALRISDQSTWFDAAEEF